MLFAAFDLDAILSDSGQKIAVAAIVAVVSSAASFMVGRYWGWWKAHREWHKKEFMSRVIVSLNMFADGGLKIRTVIERSLEEVFLNQIAIDKVLEAADKCTPDNPIMPIDKKDRWYLLNFVLNAVAEHFVDGQVRRDAGLPVTVVKYVVFLTCEVVGDERIRKVRAMVIKQEHLTGFPYPDAMPTLENPWHADRVKTLRKAAEAYTKEPDLFLTLEVCV
jgi:hypothetical protein